MTMRPDTDVHHISKHLDGLRNPLASCRFDAAARTFKLASMCLLASMLAFPAAFAQSPSPSKPELWLELNRMEQEDGACGLTFVARNGFAQGLEELAFELVLFDDKGLVSNMNVFDFGPLAPGKTVVKRFRLQDTRCDAIGRLLINGTARCKSASNDTGICMNSLVTANRTSSEFGL